MCFFARAPIIFGLSLGMKRVSLGTKTAGSGARVEIPTKSRGQERTEDDIGTTVVDWLASWKTRRRGWSYSPERREREPQEENKLEGIVEGEPVHHADKALNHAATSSVSMVMRQVSHVTWRKWART